MAPEHFKVSILVVLEVSLKEECIKITIENNWVSILVVLEVSLKAQTQRY